MGVSVMSRSSCQPLGWVRGGCRHGAGRAVPPPPPRRRWQCTLSTIYDGCRSIIRQLHEAAMDKIEQRVVVTDSQALLEPGIESLRARGVDVEVLPEGTTGAEAASKAADAPAAIIGLLLVPGTRDRRAAPDRAPGPGGHRLRHHRCRGGDGRRDLGRQRPRLLRRRGRRPRAPPAPVGVAPVDRARTRVARRSLGQREPRPTGPPDPWAAPRDRRLRADRAGRGAAGARLRLRGRGP